MAKNNSYKKYSGKEAFNTIGGRKTKTSNLEVLGENMKAATILSNPKAKFVKEDVSPDKAHFAFIIQSVGLEKDSIVKQVGSITNKHQSTQAAFNHLIDANPHQLAHIIRKEYNMGDTEGTKGSYRPLPQTELKIDETTTIKMTVVCKLFLNNFEANITNCDLTNKQNLRLIARDLGAIARFYQETAIDAAKTAENCIVKFLFETVYDQSLIKWQFTKNIKYDTKGKEVSEKTDKEILTSKEVQEEKQMFDYVQNKKALDKAAEQTERNGYEYLIPSDAYRRQKEYAKKVSKMLNEEAMAQYTLDPEVEKQFEIARSLVYMALDILPAFRFYMATARKQGELNRSYSDLKDEERMNRKRESNAIFQHDFAKLRQFILQTALFHQPEAGYDEEFTNQIVYFVAKFVSKTSGYFTVSTINTAKVVMERRNRFLQNCMKEECLAEANNNSKAFEIKMPIRCNNLKQYSDGDMILFTNGLDPVSHTVLATETDEELFTGVLRYSEENNALYKLHELEMGEVKGIDNNELLCFASILPEVDLSKVTIVKIKDVPNNGKFKIYNQDGICIGHLDHHVDNDPEKCCLGNLLIGGEYELKDFSVAGAFDNTQDGDEDGEVEPKKNAFREKKVNFSAILTIDFDWSLILGESEED